MVSLLICDHCGTNLASKYYMEISTTKGPIGDTPGCISQGGNTYHLCRKCVTELYKFMGKSRELTWVMDDES
jgi:hypothetical protein